MCVGLQKPQVGEWLYNNSKQKSFFSTVTEMHVVFGFYNNLD